MDVTVRNKRLGWMAWTVYYGDHTRVCGNFQGVCGIFNLR